METAETTPTRRRQVRYLATVVAVAVVVGLLYGVLLATVGQPHALTTQWGTFLRALLAVLLCLSIAQAIDRKMNGQDPS